MTPQHQQFINEYFRFWNGTDAYLVVYPKVSRATARANAARLLANASIAAEIQRRIDENTMCAAEVLVRLTEQARGAHGQYLSAFGVDLGALLRDRKGHLVKSIKETQYGKHIEFYDAQAALQLLGKHRKLFVERHEHTGKDGGPIEHRDVTELSDDELTHIAAGSSSGITRPSSGAK